MQKKNAKDVSKKEKSNQYAILLGLKIINYVANAKDVKKKKKWLKPINGLIKKFSNTHQFCYGDIKKFVLLLGKDVYPHEYMNSWERCDEPSLLDKKAFTVNYIWKILLLKSTHMLKKCLKN